MIQGEIIKRAKEAEAIAKVFIANKIYGGVWTSLIRRTLNGYNVKDLTPDESKLAFTEILKVMSEEAGSTFRIIMDDINFKLYNIKTKKDLILYKDLGTVVSRDLTKLKIDISIIRSDYEVEIATGKTKARREVKLEEMNAKISNEVAKSPVGAYFRVLQLNSEDIPEPIKAEIARLCDDCANQVTLKEGVSNYGSEVAKIKRKFKRRAFNEFLFVYKQ